MKILTLIIALMYVLNTVAQHTQLPFKLQKDWEISGFENPESVVLDTKNNVLYISNVNGPPTDKDNNGYISKVSLDGKIIEKKWVTGFHAPKGLTIYKNNLYVTDIDKIVVIDISNKESMEFMAKDATFLNDITADNKGNIYASNTFGFSGIYKLSNSKNPMVTLWMKSDDLAMPNGIYAKGKNLYVVSWGVGLDPKTFATDTPGHFIKINTKDKTQTPILSKVGNLDGLSQTLHGFLMTDWIHGKLLYYSNKNKSIQEALDLPKGSADIFFDKKNKSVYIPLMLDNQVLKYSFK